MKKYSFSLTPADHKTHRSLPFTVIPGQTKLLLTVDYSPKVIENRGLFNRMVDREAVHLSLEEREKLKRLGVDQSWTLSNLLSLTLISPRGVAGCAHRSDNHQIIEIGEEFATPGFFPCKPERGEWKLIVSVSSLYEEAQVEIVIGERNHE
jgi:hypothetical protein